MTLEQRQKKLIDQISKAKDENLLMMLEEEMACYSTASGARGLSPSEIKELTELASDDTEENIVSEQEYLERTARWRIK
jgi:hypothetical protein